MSTKTAWIHAPSTPLAPSQAILKTRDCGTIKPSTGGAQNCQSCFFSPTPWTAPKRHDPKSTLFVLDRFAF